MIISFYQLNVTRDIAVGVYFPTFDEALKWAVTHPRELGYHSIETIFKK